jgi:hypothetical protein
MAVEEKMAVEDIEIHDSFLNREIISTNIKNILIDFDKKIKDVNFKKGIYLYGSSGSGKTHFIKQILKEINYDIIHYNAGDVRNKTLIENIASNNISTQNVLKMMRKQKQNIAIIMDEIDGMNNGDKGSITALIKLIRQKKTKKQRLENQTLNPIICIGNYFMDKKIKELMKVCHVFEIIKPTNIQLTRILNERHIPKESLKHLLDYIQGDLRKLNFICKLFQHNPRLFDNEGEKFREMFQKKTNNDDSKTITQTLLHNYIPLQNHCQCINETDRTIVALLWHENIIDSLSFYKDISCQKKCDIYLKILQQMCFADYTDRITFQNQIWQFNEMSSLIKTFFCNKLFHDFLRLENYSPPICREIRFTKVLTKYSTEYNNNVFIYHLCNKLEMDKKDLITMFHEFRMNLITPKIPIKKMESLFNDFCNKIEDKINHLGIDYLDVKRMYRYLDKNVKRTDIFSEDGDEF